VGSNDFSSFLREVMLVRTTLSVSSFETRLFCMKMTKFIAKILSLADSFIIVVFLELSSTVSPSTGK